MTSISDEAYEQLRRQLKRFVEQEFARLNPLLKPGDNLTVNIALTVNATDEVTGEYINLLEHHRKVSDWLLLAYKVQSLMPKEISVVLN